MGFLVRKTIESYFALRIPRLGASVAFYTILSLAPLAIVVVAIASFVFSREAATGQLLWQLENLIGVQGAEVIRNMLDASRAPRSGTLATIIGLMTLFFGSTAAVGELRDGLNYIWGVQDNSGFGLHAIVTLLRDRTKSFLLVVGVGFLLLVSLAVNTAVAAAGEYLWRLLPAHELVLQLADTVLSFLVITFLFALLYRFLPSVPLEWEDVLIGSCITSVLFSLGKLLIGLYLGKASFSSAFGAAGSLVVLVVWVYYSAQIFYLGAMFTKIYADNFGSKPGRRAAKKVEVVQSLGGEVMTSARAGNLEVPR
jgi:membrane protein